MPSAAAVFLIRGGCRSIETTTCFATRAVAESRIEAFRRRIVEEDRLREKKKEGQPAYAESASDMTVISATCRPIPGP